MPLYDIKITVQARNSSEAMREAMSSNMIRSATMIPTVIFDLQHVKLIEIKPGTYEVRRKRDNRLLYGQHTPENMTSQLGYESALERTLYHDNKEA